MYEKSEGAYIRALEGYEQVYGSELMMTRIPAINAIQGYALLSECRGNYEKAREKYSRALEDIEIIYGKSVEWYKKVSLRLLYLDKRFSIEKPQVING